MSDKPIVELVPAFFWICPDCDGDNFERGILYEASEEDIAEMREEHGIEPWIEGNFVTAPKAVTCDHCGHTFDAFDWRADDDEDYDG